MGPKCGKSARLIPIADIIIGERVRKELDPEALQELASSISELGLLNPIVVEEREGRFHLIAGFRRLNACRMLGYDEIPITILNLDELGKRKAELEENTMRKQLTWQEECEALAKIIEEEKQKGTPICKIPQKIGMSRRRFYYLKSLVEGLKKNPSLAKEEKASRAYAQLKARKEMPSGPRPKIEVRQDDALNLRSVCEYDLIILDPPRLSSDITCLPSDEMPEAELRDFAFKLMPKVFTALKPSGYCLIFTGFNNVWQEAALAAGLSIRKIPLVWVKTQFSGENAWEPILLCWKLKRAIIRPLEKDIILCPDILHKKHPYEKPTAVISHLLHHFSPEGSTILDPFCGSGAVLEACAQAGRNALGIDINPTYVSMASERLKEDSDGQ